MKPNASAKTAQVVSLNVLNPVKAEEAKVAKEVEEVKNETVPVSSVVPVVNAVESVSQLKSKIAKLGALSRKHEELITKLTRLEMFAINKDNDTAHIHLVDAKGVSFDSSNPVCIGKVIEIWKETYAKNILEAEKEMFTLMQ
jgi:hypothetical protein